MHSTWYQTTLAIIHFTAKIGLLALIVHHRKLKAWPSIATYTAAGVVMDILLAANLQHHYGRYFYIYWTWTLVAALLRLWIIADVLRSFPGTTFLPFSVPAAFASFGIALAAGAAYVSSQAGSVFSSSPSMRIVHAAVLVDRGATIAWGTFLLATLLAVWIIGLGWSREGALICNGLAVNLFGTMLFAYLVSLAARPGRLAGDAIGGICAVAGTVIWGAAMRLPPEVFTVPPNLALLSHRLRQSTAEEV